MTAFLTAGSSRLPGNDDLIAIRVRLKAESHQRASGVCFFASFNVW